ncbi:MAG: hypothetical protein ACRC0L_10180, partial [Angustibacter sp.]
LGLDVGLTAASLGAGGAVKGSARGAAATRFTHLLEAAGDAGLDIRAAAAAARLRLNTTLTARLDHLTTLGDDLSDHLDALRPATHGVPTSRTVLDNHVMRHEPAALGHGHPGQTVDGTGDAANPHTPPDQHASEPDNRGPEQPEGASESPAVDPAQQQRIADLARDPAEGGKIDADTIAEAEVGLALEERGDVSGLRRSPHEGAEFIDADGNAWDVKGFHSELGRFDLDKAMTAIWKEMNWSNENIMLDTRNLSSTDITRLREAIEAGKAHGELPLRVLWWP